MGLCVFSLQDDVVALDSEGWDFHRGRAGTGVPGEQAGCDIPARIGSTVARWVMSEFAGGASGRSRKYLIQARLCLIRAPNCEARSAVGLLFALSLQARGFPSWP